MFKWLAKIVTEHPRKIIGTWIILLLSSAYFAVQLPDSLSAGGFNDPNSESATTKEVLEKKFENRHPQTLILVISNKKYSVSDPVFKEAVDGAKQIIQQNDLVASVETYYETKNEKLVSKDQKKTFLMIGIEGTENQANNLVPKLSEQLTQQGGSELKNFKWWVTGGPSLTYALNDATKQEVTKAEIIAIPAMILILLVVLGTAASTVVPLIMIAFALGTTMAVCYFIADQVTLNILLTNAVSMIGLGVVVDYCLFLMSRFRQELQKYESKKAVRISVMTAGRAVFFSGVTVAISLSSLFLPNIMIFNSIAIGGVIVVIFSVLVANTLLPSVLVLMGTKINWGAIPFLQRKKSRSRWESFSHRLMKRPVLFLIPVILLLLVFSWPVQQVKMQVPVASASILPENNTARDGFEVLAGEFGQGDVFPIEVAMRSKNGNILSPDSLEDIDSVTRKIEKLDNVKEVTSLTNWNKDWKLDQYKRIYKNTDSLPDDAQNQLSNLVNLNRGQDTAILLVSAKTPADSKATHDLVKEVRQVLDHETIQTFQYHVGGETATGLDFDQRVIGSFPYIIVTVLAISFFILVITFRSLLIPLKALMLNSLVMLASLGLLVYLFLDGEGSTINSVTPVVLFAVLFGLSMDYEVLIISRMREFHEAGFSNRESVAKGIAATAGLVNGAAAIMIAVFAAFSLVKIRIVAELGFGLAISILLDATLVRSVLVPTSMRLLGSANWWLPFIRSRKIKGEAV